MADQYDHRCTDPECCSFGCVTGKSCGCHQSREQMMLAHIAALIAASEWRPIESAPKDGWHILARLPGSDTCYVICWVDKARGIRSELGDQVGWHIAWDGYFIGAHEQPTCWMPLPQRPAPNEARS